jgi:hypothetical protein
MNSFTLVKKALKRWRHDEETFQSLLVRVPFFFNPRRWLCQKSYILKEQWDILLLLDACRYDTFAEVNALPGLLSKRCSLGSHTVEWSSRNFEGKNCSDIIYISANPQVSNLKLSDWSDGMPFFSLIDVWLDAWDEEKKTVLPDKVNRFALKAFESYPDKRFILHYLQPHNPFVGKVQLGKGAQQAYSTAAQWQRYVKSRGEQFQKKVKLAYKANLEYVLESVAELVKELPRNKKIVITADHGEALGEWGVYSHPPMTYLSSLVEVPWFVCINN